MGQYSPTAGDREMNKEFGRRIRSFLTKGIWWDIVQLAASDLGCSGVWQVVIAGCPDLTKDDFNFAESIHWCVNRRDFDISNVANYEYGNWFYSLVADAPLATATPVAFGTKTIVKGTVTVQLGSPETSDEATAKARKFVEAMIGVDHIAKIVDIGVQPVSQSAKVFDVTGTVYLK